jgi:hypothetical protein
MLQHSQIVFVLFCNLEISKFYSNTSHFKRKKMPANVCEIDCSSFILLFLCLKDAGLGTDSLTAIYVALIFSCMFLPSGMIKHLTAKWTMCVCMICYSTYIAAQFYPEYYTLVKQIHICKVCTIKKLANDHLRIVINSQQ